MLKIRSETEKKILNYFFSNPQKKCYVNELARIIEDDPGNVHKKLKELEEKRLLVAEMQGREKFYSLNKQNTLLKDIKKIFQAEYGLEAKLREILEPVDGIEEAYIYGSYARGKMKLESDIDVLLIGDHSALEASDKLYHLEKNIGREINIVDLTRKEFEAKKKDKNEFINDIFGGPTIKIK